MLTTAVVVMLPGCIAIPLKSGEAEPLEPHQFDFVEIGRSTKAEIAAAMSGLQVTTAEGSRTVHLQPLEYRDGNHWLYGSSRREMEWFVGIPYVDAGVTYTLDYKFALFIFNDAGVVQDFVLSGSEGGCNDEGVCPMGTVFMLSDEANTEGLEPVTEPQQEHCRVYFFAKHLQLPAPVWLDGAAKGWLVHSEGLWGTQKTYMAWEVDPGDHLLESLTNEETFRVGMDFGCKAGDMIFLQLNHRRRSLGHWRTNFTELEAKKGHKAVMKRRRLINPSNIPNFEERVEKANEAWSKVHSRR